MCSSWPPTAGCATPGIHAAPTRAGRQAARRCLMQAVTLENGDRSGLTPRPDRTSHLGRTHRAASYQGAR